MTEGVKLFLRSLNLEQYFDMFTAKGFDLETDICHLNSADLDSMYITENSHRKQILDAVPHYNPSREFLLYEWLREKGLDHYFISFVQSDLIDLSAISRLNLPDDDLYDELEITLPGHKKRLERAVRQLAKKHRMSIPTFGSSQESLTSKKFTTESGDVTKPEDKMEIPIAYGRWGKPKCLLEAKYDFLILDATVASTIDPLDRVQIEFMVDSGSDVVTLREEVLDSLGLELIGPIRSKGVHSSKTKNLYRANMIIGNHTLEIEVMGETYDSIGSRVIRHFRHYITGNRHIWLKGDFIDPTIQSNHISPVAVSQTVSTETESSPASQEMTHEHQETSTTEVPSVSSTEKAGGEPEERELYIESEATSKEKMEETDITVQKDSGVPNGHLKRTAKHFPATDLHSIEFSFKTSEDIDTNVGDRNDETDLLKVHDDGIIDVRPFIEANRAKQVKLTENCHSEKYKETKIRINNRALKNGIDGSNFSSVDVSKVPKVVEKQEETYLSQRSVYYRSQQS